MVKMSWSNAQLSNGRRVETSHSGMAVVDGRKVEWPNGGVVDLESSSMRPVAGQGGPGVRTPLYFSGSLF